MKQVTLWKRPLRAAELAYENDSSGFWVDRLEGDHSIELVRATVYADQDGTLYLDESDDEGTTSAALATVSVSAEVTYKLSWTTLTKRWYRFRYVNGSTDQTKFRVTKETAGEDLVLIQLLHDRLNANVNLQVGDADVTTSNSVPVNVRSIQAGNNNIGDVDIASMPDVTIGAEIPTGTKVIGKVGIDQVTANANEVVTKTGSVTAATLNAETTKVIGTVNNKVADGDDIALGAKADAAATAADTTPFSVIALLKGLWNKLAGTLTVQLTGSNTRKSFSSTITIGTGAAHSANDVVSTDAGAIMELDLATLLAAGKSGVIYSLIVTLDQNAVFSGGMGYEVYLYNVSPTVQADNAAFNQDDASLPGYIGKVTVGALVDEGDNCVAENFGYNIDFSLAAADTKLYAKAKCLGGETTISGAILTFILGIGTL